MELNSLKRMIPITKPTLPNYEKIGDKFKEVINSGMIANSKYVKEFAKDVGVVSALIRDAGKTQLDPGTITCLAIGPDEVKKVDSVSGDLKMM